MQTELTESEHSESVGYVVRLPRGSLRPRLKAIFLHPSLVMNAVSNWTVTMVNVVMGFFLTPFIIRCIGKSDYGIWTLVGSIVGYFGIIGLGVTGAITPYTARYIGQNDWQTLGKFVNSTLTVFTVIGLIALTASFALAAPSASFFEISPERFAAFRNTLWVVGLASAVGFPDKVFKAVVRGHENYVAGNCIDISTTLLRAGLTVWLLSEGFGLLGAALALAASETVSLGASAILFLVLVKNIRIKLFSVSRQMLRILLVYGGTTMVISISNMLRFQIDSAVIGKFLGIEAVAVYAIAAILMRYFLRGIRDALRVLKPRFAVLYGSGRREELRQTLFRSMTIAGTCAFGGAALLIVFGRHLIHLWVGTNFTDAAPVLYVLVGALAFEMAQNPGINVLFALDRIRPLAALWIVEGVLNVLLSLLLVGPLGIIGVALGTAIPCFTLKTMVLPFLITRAAGVSVVKYYMYILASLLPFGAVILLAALFGAL